MMNKSSSLKEKRMIETESKKSFLAYMVSLSIFTIVLISFTNWYIETSSFREDEKDDIQNMKQMYLDHYKDTVQNKVFAVEQEIKYQQKIMETRLKDDLKQKIETALNVASTIYKNDKDKLTKNEIKAKIVGQLSAIRFYQGRGYYFIYDSKTNILLSHALKKFIGRDMTHFKDLKGLNIADEYTRVLKKDKIAFTKIYFNKPNDKIHEYPKIVAVTRFKPLGITIGTGEYLDIVKKETQQNVLKRLQFDKNKKNYIFIYDIHNINGGDNFATMILNQNRPDLVGKMINDNYKDAKGKEFRKEMLKGIRQKGETFVKYWYKKPSTKSVEPKMSYFYYDKDWHWVIASGFYFDDLEKEIKKEEQEINEQIEEITSNTIKITILLSLIILFITLLIALKIDKTIKYYIQQLASKSNELQETNQSLEQKIKKALKENTKQLEILQQQSKLASMGEMIGAIAHQWRQPLNELGLSIQNLKYDFKDGAINEEFIDNFIDYNKKIIMFMSKTIDDFRNFFRVDKEKKEFNVKETTKSVLTMLSAQLKNHNIEAEIDGDEFAYKGLQSEYKQVILNIINNAKDALIENRTKNPKVEINIKDKKVTIKDNAGGIPKDIINRVFEPYFTTKEQGKGTGMGLYMSKMIIEENMGGKLSVENADDGAVFMIDLNEQPKAVARKI